MIDLLWGIWDFKIECIPSELIDQTQRNFCYEIGRKKASFFNSPRPT